MTDADGYGIALAVEIHSKSADVGIGHGDIEFIVVKKFFPLILIKQLLCIIFAFYWGQ